MEAAQGSSAAAAHNGLASARQEGRVSRPLAPGLGGLCASVAGVAG
jgi:hypothetical protein